MFWSQRISFIQALNFKVNKNLENFVFLAGSKNSLKKKKNALNKLFIFKSVL